MKDQQSRIEWACRRGMLECELFFIPFVQAQFGSLSELERTDLYDLLQYPDPVLYEWLMGKTKPTGADARFLMLIEKIRDNRAYV